MRVPSIIAAATTVVLALPAHAQAVTASATRPATVAGSTALYARDVKSAVTVSGAATITLTNLAYRHPEVVQATRKVTAAGRFSIRDRCKPSTLPYTWIVRVNGVEVSRAKLKCR